MKTLLIAEHNNLQLNEATGKALTAATAMGNPVDVLVFGHQCAAVADQAAGLEGVSHVLLADDEKFQHFIPGAVLSALAALAADYSHIVAPATSVGKTLLPGLAALLDVAQLSDICKVLSPDTFVRPVYAGNALATVKSLDATKVITVRTSAFASARQGQSQVETIPTQLQASMHGTGFIEARVSESQRPDLSSARVVVSGGRGLGSQENFALVTSLADKLGGAVGASRAAVDAGYVTNDLQVGQTGKIVAPELYIAIGISGAIQHLAGMKDSKVVVAINNDAEAPIFQSADYGLVGDLFTVVPELENLL